MKTLGDLNPGDKYNRLTVVIFVEKTNRYVPMWEFRCECGEVIVRSLYDVKSGKSKSCGCLRKETSTSHGMCDTHEYYVWAVMKNRCHCETNSNYDNYGGRGITVCDEWRDSFEAFYRDMGPRPSKHHSIDRINNDLGYCKENCRWATDAEQIANRRASIWLEYKGETKLLAHVEKEMGLRATSIKKWLSRGLTLDEIEVYARNRKHWVASEVFIYISDSQVDLDFKNILGHDDYILLSKKVESPTCIIYKLLIKGKRKYK